MSGPGLTDEERAYLAWAESSDPMTRVGTDGLTDAERAWYADDALWSATPSGPVDPAIAAEAERERARAEDAFAMALEDSSPYDRTVAMPGTATPPAAPASPPMSAAEEALWRAAAGLPPLGSGGGVSLPGATVAPFGEPAAGAPTVPGLRAPAPAAPPPAAAGAPAPRPRRTGLAVPAAPSPPEDPGAALVDALTNRPADDPSLFGAYDNRPESRLDRDLRLNDVARVLEQRRAELAASAAAEMRDRMEAEIAARQQLETERRAAEGSARASYRRAADRAAAMSVDPDGFYHSRGVGGTIASAIAIGLGGLSSAVSGGPNVVLQMINDEIERDLDAQRQRIDSAFRRADAEGTLYDMTRQEYADRGAALDAARALALEAAAQQVAEAEASLGSAEARHNAEVMAAQLRDAAAAAAAEAQRAEMEWQLRMQLLEARARERMAAAQRAEARLAGAGGPAPIDPVTGEELNVYNRLIDSGMAPEDAAASSGVDPRVVGAASATRFAEASSGPDAARDAELSAALDRLEAALPGDPNADIPGVGMTGERVIPNWAAFLLSDEGRTVRAEARNVVDLLGRSRTGANMPPSELEAFRAILMGEGETDEGLREGIARLRDMVGGRTRRTREGRTADAVEAEAISGTTARRVVD